MDVFLSTVVICLIGLFLQFIIWRINRPKNELTFIFFIFNGSLLFFLLVNYFLRFYDFSIWNITHVVLFVLGITFSYMTTYTVISLTSPTFAILLAVKKSGKSGMIRDDFNELITEDKFISTRIVELLESNQIEIKDERYYITDSGIKFLNIFVTLRRIINQRAIGG